MPNKIELLPLPEGEASSFGSYEVHTNEAMIEYARANVLHHTATLQAEIEALRAEVERLRTDGASAVRWAPGSAYWSDVLRDLFGPDARNGIDVVEARWRKELERADKLAEALEEIRSRTCINEAMNPNPFALTAMLGDIHHIADTALAKENSNEGESIYLRLVPRAGRGDEMGSSSCWPVPEGLSPVQQPDGRSEHEQKLAEFGNRV